jgi:hypothetical protein
MKVKEFVTKLRKDHEKLDEHTKEAIAKLTGKVKAYGNKIKTLTKALSDAKEQIAAFAKLLNKVAAIEDQKAEQEQQPVVADDGESWDPSLGPRKKRNTCASAVAADDMVFIKRRANDPKAAKKDNR